MFCQIVEEKFPFRHLPKTRHFVIVEANHERRYQIEFLSKVGQRAESFYSPDYPADAEKTRDFPKHRQPIDVESQSGMAEQLSDVKKVSGAAAKIENALRPRQIELELANPANVNSDPAFEIEIFRPVRAGLFNSISLTDLLETNGINRLDYPFRLQWETLRVQQSERMFPRAGQAPAIYQFSHFVTESHG